MRERLPPQPLVMILVERLVAPSPPDPLLGAGLADDEFVLGRTAGVPARVDDERATMRKHSLVAPQCVHVEDRRRQVPVDVPRGPDSVLLEARGGVRRHLLSPAFSLEILGNVLLTT